MIVVDVVSDLHDPAWTGTSMSCGGKRQSLPKKRCCAKLKGRSEWSDRKRREENAGRETAAEASNQF